MVIKTTQNTKGNAPCPCFLFFTTCILSRFRKEGEEIGKEEKEEEGKEGKERRGKRERKKRRGKKRGKNGW